MGDEAAERDRHPPTRATKFRQAAFVYLHVGLLYEYAVWAIWRRGLLEGTPGPVWLWLLLGAAVVALVFWLLWYRQSAWAARIVWAIHGLRLPSLIQGAFFPAPDARLPETFYLTAFVVVLANLWTLARAGWDL